MARVSRRESLPLEDMAEVAAAARALDLHPFPVRVGDATHRPRDLLVEGRPTAVGVEFVVRPIERSPALSALVRSGPEVRLVLAGERGLGSLVEYHALLGARKRSQSWSRVGHIAPFGGEY